MCDMGRQAGIGALAPVPGIGGSGRWPVGGGGRTRPLSDNELCLVGVWKGEVGGVPFILLVLTAPSLGEGVLARAAAAAALDCASFSRTATDSSCDLERDRVWEAGRLAS